MINNKLLLTFTIFFLSMIISVHAQKIKRDLIQYKNIKWTFETQAPIHGSPVESEQSIYFGSGDHCIYAVDKASGKLEWKYTTKGPIYSTPFIAGDKLFCTSLDGNLYALNKSNGKLLWKFLAEQDKQKDIWDYHNGSPLVDEDMVYYGNGNGNFYAINKDNGKKIWEYKTKAIIHNKPVIDKEKVYFGNFDGVLYALNKETGEKIWTFNTIGQKYFPKGAIQQGPTIHNNVVYFGSRDFNMYALNAETGTGMWNMYETGSWVIATPTIRDSLLLFGTSDTHHFYAMDARNGAVKWKKKININVFGQCETGDKLVYFGALNGKIYAINLLDGKTVWEFQTKESKDKWDKIFNAENKFSKKFIEVYGTKPKKFYDEIHSLGSIVSKPLLSNGVLYFTSMNGKLYAIE